MSIKSLWLLTTLSVVAVARFKRETMLCSEFFFCITFMECLQSFLFFFFWRLFRIINTYMRWRNYRRSKNNNEHTCSSEWWRRWVYVLRMPRQLCKLVIASFTETNWTLLVFFCAWKDTPQWIHYDTIKSISKQFLQTTFKFQLRRFAKTKKT